MLGFGMTGKSVSVVHKVRVAGVRSQGGLYIAMEPDRFTVVKGKNLPA